MFEIFGEMLDAAKKTVGEFFSEPLDAAKKRVLVTESLKFAGIEDPRTLAALASLLDAKIVMGPSNIQLAPEKLSGFAQFSVNGDPVEVEVTFRGKIIDQVEALLCDLGLKNPPAPDMLQPSPSAVTAAPGPQPVDFLSPVATAPRIAADGVTTKV